MKTNYCIALFIILFAILSIASADEVLITSSGRVNVRELPDVNSTAIGMVDPGKSYIYLGTADNGWLKIQLPTGLSGYISGKMGKVFQNDSNVQASNTQVVSVNPTTSADGGMTRNSNNPDVIIKNIENSPLKIIEAGFYTTNGYWTAIGLIHNEDPENIIFLSTIKMIARNKKGEIIDTNDVILGYVFPNGNSPFVSLVSSLDGETMASLELEIEPISDYSYVSLDSKYPNYQPIQVSSYNVKERKVLGEVYNPNPYDIKSCNVSIFFRNEQGILVYGEDSHVSNLKANSKAVFEINLRYPNYATSTYEVYAYFR